MRSDSLFFPSSSDESKPRRASLPPDSEAASALCTNDDEAAKLKVESAHGAALRFPAWKRGLDLGLIVLTAPAWLPVGLAVCLWIKLVSRGPLFFRQERIGYQRESFVIYKFRSMRVDAETECHSDHVKELVDTDRPMTKLDVTDCRLIPGACVLRATGLDELPQLINVFKQEMSIVGPRPCLRSELANYGESGLERFDSVPGLTGYWQVMGKNRTTFKEMVDLDIYYARHRSPWLDLGILIRTPAAIIVQIGDIIKAMLNDRRGTPASKVSPSN